MKITSLTKCSSCGAEYAFVVEEPRYNGLRGICVICEGNWPES